MRHIDSQSALDNQGLARAETPSSSGVDLATTAWFTVTPIPIADWNIGSTNRYNASLELITLLDDLSNGTVPPTGAPQLRGAGSLSAWSSGQLQIPLYALIFLLSVAGNALVIVTLVQNKRMRTVTNVFLLNLAVSDLLLGVFCMPFTLVGTLLRQFIFGETMCRAIPYLQAVSVSVSAWTLVAISVERYFAICQPLRSRRWQTLRHSYKMIAGVWIGSLACMLPIAVLSELQLIRGTGKAKCREAWPDDRVEQAFNLWLDLVLLVVPLFIMIITYSLITSRLCQGMKFDMVESNRQEDTRPSPTQDGSKSTMQLNGKLLRDQDDDARTLSPSSPNGNSNPTLLDGHSGTEPTITRRSPMPCRRGNTHLRRCNTEKSQANKERVIKMLFVVVLEFFICWTPLYVINTITLFDPKAVYGGLGVAGISLCQLLAYASSCCNPITYCFMNARFRRAFISAFGCCCVKRSWNHAASRSSTSYSLKTSSFYAKRWTDFLLPTRGPSRDNV